MVMEITNEVTVLVLSVVYALIGLVLLLIGYRLVDRFTPTDAQKKIFEEGNVAVAILIGAFVLGLALIISAAISG
jgi:uncharacterized membrane protein YjfL (UPF0719 family)